MILGSAARLIVAETTVIGTVDVPTVMTAATTAVETIDVIGTVIEAVVTATGTVVAIAEIVIETSVDVDAAEVAAHEAKAVALRIAEGDDGIRALSHARAAGQGRDLARLDGTNVEVMIDATDAATMTAVATRTRAAHAVGGASAEIVVADVVITVTRAIRIVTTRVTRMMRKMQEAARGTAEAKMMGLSSVVTTACMETTVFAIEA